MRSTAPEAAGVAIVQVAEVCVIRGLEIAEVAQIRETQIDNRCWSYGDRIAKDVLRNSRTDGREALRAAGIVKEFRCRSPAVETREAGEQLVASTDVIIDAHRLLTIIRSGFSVCKIVDTRAMS